MAAACLLLSVLYVLAVTPSYLVTSRLYAAHPANLAPQQSTAPADRAYLNTQAKVLGSTPTLALALSQPGIGELSMFDDVADRIEFLKNELEISVGEKDEIVTIEFESAYPREAERFLAALVESYLKYQSTQIKSSAGQLLMTLQKQHRENQQELKRKREELVQFKRQHGTLSFDDEKSSFVIRALNSLSDSLIAARIQKLNAKAAYDEAARALPERGAGESDDQAIALDDRSEADLRSSLTYLEQRLQTLRHYYGPNHPQVQASEVRARGVRVALVAALKRRVEAAAQMEADLQKSFDQQQKLALDQAGKAAEFARLDAEARRLEKTADILDNHINALTLTDEARAASLQVLEPASASQTPIAPRKLRALAVGALLGLMLGIGMGSIREIVEVRLRTAEEVSAAVGLPVLAVVPPMPLEQTPASHARVLSIDPFSAASDAIRSVCTALRHYPTRQPVKTLLVTSPGPDEGKTTVAANLAAALVASRQRVLLIDGDSRMPVLHEIFDLSNDVGLDRVLEGAVGWRDAVRHTSDNHLDVLPCGPVAGNTLELLNSPALGELLNELGQDYDHIVIDAPPLSAGPDARNLGANCDLTLLVVRGDRVLRAVIERAINDLVTVGATIMGLVVNLTRPDADYQPPAKHVYKAANRFARSVSVNGNGHSSDNGHHPSAEQSFDRRK